MTQPSRYYVLVSSCSKGGSCRLRQSRPYGRSSSNVSCGHSLSFINAILYFRRLSPSIVLQCRTCLDVLLVPGLGFDRTGRRLGRGGGYYDKMISQLQHLATEAGRQPPLLVALSYEAQLVSAVPIDEHDQPVDLVVTASEVVQCTKRGADAMMEMR
ncbi:hypothetical protein Vafri_1680 [Volvox africanus]|nr:hypothetical protein Vafri_1680 [Volvox africanus]